MAWGNDHQRGIVAQSGVAGAMWLAARSATAPRDSPFFNLRNAVIRRGPWAASDMSTPPRSGHALAAGTIGSGWSFEPSCDFGGGPEPCFRPWSANQRREISVSFDVMNSSRAGFPSFVAPIPRWIAGIMSSVCSIRSPWPPKARAIAA
jgi:hypothetical protein